MRRSRQLPPRTTWLLYGYDHQTLGRVPSIKKAATRPDPGRSDRQDIVNAVSMAIQVIRQIEDHQQLGQLGHRN